MLILYASVLGSSEIDSAGGDAAAERALGASRDAFAAARYADALQPTIELMRALPQPAGVRGTCSRLIYQHLGRPADEAGSHRSGLVDCSSTNGHVTPFAPMNTLAKLLAVEGYSSVGEHGAHHTRRSCRQAMRSRRSTSTWSSRINGFAARCRKSGSGSTG